MSYRTTRFAVKVSLLLSLFSGSNFAIGQVGPDFIPRKQSAPPGPPLSPQQALEKMEVPEGFHVELVASEPDIMNPVAMAFDERGRIYVTESFEYPRREPGPGRDRIKILEDKDGDGHYETVKVFAEGLNIPSGIAVGHGGVWVANAPDILFMEDTDGDDKADKSTVVVTGFGRDDTHELPNAFTWGPDGALYGLNGVFNPSSITQDGKTHRFTCAMFRIDPKTHKFDVFCEGTSNPWGIAFDHEGSAFVSACVIDHLWHLTESAYYRRQAGPYPAHTFFAESIVKHKHQMAAYCGIEFVDTDAYPSEFNNKLYMGNIHGGCINSDSIKRFGATYQATGNPDFMTANDVWFMPVAQKVGPDGCLYVLDWYDRYHCYQDANADPAGVDRGRGRLYRVVHKQRPNPRVKNFANLSSTELINLLSDPNIYNRQKAQLTLQTRGFKNDEKAKEEILAVIADAGQPIRARLHALFALAGSGEANENDLLKLAQSQTAEIRAWSIRTIGRMKFSSEDCKRIIENAASDKDSRVQIEASIVSGKIAGESPEDDVWNVRNQTNILKAAEPLTKGEIDPILSRVVWQNMLPQLPQNKRFVAESLTSHVANKTVASVIPRFATFLLATNASDTEGASGNEASQSTKTNLDLVFDMVTAVSKQDKDLAAQLLDATLVSVKKREIHYKEFKPKLIQWLQTVADSNEFKVPNTKTWSEWDRWATALFQCHLISGDENCLACVRAIFSDEKSSVQLKQELLSTANMVDTSLLKAAFKGAIETLSRGSQIDAAYLDAVIDLSVSKMNKADVLEFGKIATSLPVGVQAKLAERFCQRSETAPALLELLEANSIRKELISPNTIRLLSQSQDSQVQKLVRTIWGTINIESTKEREKVVAAIAEKLAKADPGNPERGWLVYDRTCGQCHVMHGKGKEVGPNITANGRGAFDQLLISVFNPSLVIGEAYKSVTLRTVDDEIVTGLLVDRNEQRTVIKLQGGQERIIPASDIEEFKVDSKSLMPEGLESQLSDQELADLFALLSLEKAPGSKDNATISGTPDRLHAGAGTNQ